MVVALHSITPYISDAAIYGKKSWYVYLFINAVTRGGVSLFLMISGYLMLNDDASRDFSVFYRKRLSRILIPLCIWNVIYYVFYCVFNGAPFKLTELAAKSIDCGTAYHFWYVYTLFGIYLVHVGVMDIITRYFMIDASPLVSSLYLFALTVPISAAMSLVIGKVKYLT